jgi:hypothetical protein
MRESMSARLVEAERRERRSLGTVTTYAGLLGTAFSVLAIWFTLTVDVGRPYFSVYALISAGPLLLLLGLLLRRRGKRSHDDEIAGGRTS